MKINRLVLASTSPYRRQLLEKAGVTVSLAAPLADEESIRTQMPRELARLRSELKGLSLAANPEPFLAIAADQVLEFEGKPYGKVPTPEAAAAVLRGFQGRTHFLHSAYSLVLYLPHNPPRLLQSRICSAEMKMRSLSEAEILAYVATGEWEGCAGCYQYENRGVQLFGEAKGDMATIIGLPLVPLLDDLRSLGIDTLLHPKGPWNFIPPSPRTLLSPL